MSKSILSSAFHSPAPNLPSPILVIHLCFKCIWKALGMIKGCLLPYQRFPSQFSHQNWASNLTSRDCELKGNFWHFTIQFHEFQGPQWYKCWNHKICVFSAQKWQVQSHIYRVPPKRRPFFQVHMQVLTCPKMAVQKGREPRVRYWSRVYSKLHTQGA